MKNISLLDGSIESQAVLEKNAINDEFYYGKLNTQVLSSSSIKLLVDSPKKYYYVNKYGGSESQGMRDGRLLHTLVLEPEKFEEFNWVDVASKNSKAYKEAKLEFGTVYTSKEKSDAKRLADALTRSDIALEYLNGSKFEIPKVDIIQGMPFRGKADILRNSGGICDIKTTTDIHSFKYSANKYGYDIQCYIYCELFGITHDQFTFLVLDKSSLDIGVFECSHEFYLRGKQKTELGMSRYTDWFIEDNKLDNYYIKDIL